MTTPRPSETSGADFTHHAKCPPIAPLAEVVARLERAGFALALGGSGLLAALGLSDTVRDWDLTTDAAQDETRAVVADLEPTELICRFAFHVKGGVVRIPTVVTRHWRGIPVGSAEAWAVAYALMDRGEKSERLFTWLAAHGADSGVVARLLAEPLSPALAARLGALSTSRTA
ncbi:MAG: hypothetical protein HY076_03950 [Candidatus Eisenbacteria bacterium]|uniref:Uncharacterized protein n=1 Tax=Eiseniibacteriota bacterium TaxID=2212470 RepID=A0A9D6QM55_UNCEI|nr:hypothetical protein [Candidatus Eisenbacteria bacterium]